MIKKNICISLLALVFLSGCAHQLKKTTQPTLTQKKPIQVEKTETAQSTKTKTMEHWQAEGRIAAQKGSKGQNASFVWLQRGQSYQIKLYGPFGSGSAYITGRPQHVELKEANGKITRAQTPEDLLQKVAHLQIPISGLQYWLKGSASPHTPVATQRTNPQGQLHYLEQQGWKIQYEGYNQNSTPLPSKLRLENGSVKVKMVVTKWQTL